MKNMLRIVEDNVDHNLVLFMAGNRMNLGINYHSYKDFFTMTDYELENTHNYIQWAFPTDQRSVYIEEAPCLNKKTLDAIRGVSGFVNPNMLKMADKMLAFYAAHDKWKYPDSHNLRRISRIIRSLNIIVNPTAANWFYHSIRGITLRDEINDWLPEQTQRIWQMNCHPGLYHLVK
jgi:hypothetical protein